LQTQTRRTTGDRHSVRRPAIAVSVAVMCLALLAATAATAQINPFSGRGMALAASDVALIGEIATGLLQGEAPAKGTSVEWHNAATGRRGSITMLGTSQRDGRECRELRYVLPVEKSKATRAYTVNWCKTPEGQWKTVA